MTVNGPWLLVTKTLTDVKDQRILINRCFNKKDTTILKIHFQSLDMKKECRVTATKND